MRLTIMHVLTAGARLNFSLGGFNADDAYSYDSFEFLHSFQFPPPVWICSAVDLFTRILGCSVTDRPVSSQGGGLYEASVRRRFQVFLKTCKTSFHSRIRFRSIGSLPDTYHPKEPRTYL